MDRVTSPARHIGLNAHLLNLSGTYRSAGINSYILQILSHLPPGEFKYTVLLSDRKAQEQLRGLRVIRSRLPTHRPVVRVLWEQLLQPLIIARQRLDLLHAMAFAGPLALCIPWVVTIYDLSFALYPLSFPVANRVYLNWAIRDAARRANRALAISESTKRDLVTYFGVDGTKIDVIHCGVDAAFAQHLDTRALDEWRARNHVPGRFMLHVGTLEPRKNHIGLVRAFGRAVREAKLPHSLVLIGAKGWKYSELNKVIEEEGVRDRVLLAGFVSQEELPLWYQAAELFVYPSLYEGFGLPILEAMASGTPVITSTSSSLPEVVGDAGIVVSALDEQALSDSIVHALDPRVKCQMRERGLRRARHFSWDRAARETVETYRSVLGRGVIHATA